MGLIVNPYRFASASYVDPASWADVLLQLEMPTTAGSQSFTDASTNAFTLTRTTTSGWGPRVSTTVYKMGAESADGSAANYASGTRLWIAANCSAMHLSGAFTLEGWFSFETVANCYMVGRWNESSGNRSWLIRYNTGNLQLLLSADGTTPNTKISYAWTPTTNQFYHIAVVFDGSNTYSLYIDGTRVTTASTAVTLANPTTTTFAFVMFARAVSSSTDNYFRGWIDEFRVVKAAIYSGASLTVPTGAFRRS